MASRSPFKRNLTTKIASFIAELHRYSGNWNGKRNELLNVDINTK
jgi:hypothetical protein